MNEYTIKEISKKFDIPASTLRYYEEVGILDNIERTSTGQRIYREHHVSRIRAILCFKRTGMSISKLKEFFSYEKNELEYVNEMCSLLNDQKTNVSKQLIQLQQDLEHVNRKVNYYNGIKTALEAGKPIPTWSDYKKK